VWDRAEHNPWATIPGQALIKLGHTTPPDPGAPGMFALADTAHLRELFEEAGFVDVRIEPVDVHRSYPSAAGFIEETFDCSHMFATVFHGLAAEEQAEVEREITSRLAPFITPDEGRVELPGTALGAVGDA
jgi:hypothetical protein